MWTMVPLLAVAAGVGLHVEETADLEPLERDRLTSELGAALERASGQRVRIDDPVWGPCGGGCLTEVSARLGTSEVVEVSAFAGITVIRVVIERLRADASPLRHELDLSRSANEWTAKLDEAARVIFPEPAAIISAPSPPITAPVLPPSEGPRLAPWIVLGASAVSLGVGLAFGASSASARSDSQDPALSRPQFEGLADRTQQHALAANVAFVAAGVGALVSAGLWLWE